MTTERASYVLQRRGLPATRFLAYALAVRRASGFATDSDLFAEQHGRAPAAKRRRAHRDAGKQGPRHPPSRPYSGESGVIVPASSGGPLPATVLFRRE